MQLALAQLFGEGASQTSASLIIQKSSLRGLTPSLNNRAEQLLAAIVFAGLRNFSGTLEDSTSTQITDSLGNSITFDNSTLYDELVIEQWKTLVVKNKIQHTFLINQFEVYAD